MQFIWKNLERILKLGKDLQIEGQHLKEFIKEEQDRLRAEKKEEREEREREREERVRE